MLSKLINNAQVILIAHTYLKHHVAFWTAGVLLIWMLTLSNAASPFTTIRTNQEVDPDSTWSCRLGNQIHTSDFFQVDYWVTTDSSDYNLISLNVSDPLNSIFVFCLLLSLCSASLRPALRQKPPLLQPVSSSNTRTQEGLLFLHCILKQHLSCPRSLFIPSAVMGHWQPQTQSASASGGHFGLLSVRYYCTLQPHMYSPVLLW